MKNKTKSQSAKSSTTKSLHGHSVPFLVLCVLTIIFVTILQYYLVIQAPAADRNRSFVDVTMTSYVERVISRLDSLSLAVKTTFSSPYLQQQLSSATSEQLNALESELSQRFDFVNGLRILDKDIFDVDLNSQPVITNVTLQLIREIKAGDSVKYEAIDPGKPSEHIAVLFAIPNTPKIVLIGVNYRIFNDILPEERLVPGYYELSQVFGPATTLVTHFGSAEFKQSTPLGIAQVKGTQWQIAFWPADVSKFNYEFELHSFLSGVALIIFIILGGGLFGLRQLQQMLRSDSSKLVRWLLDNPERVRMPSPPVYGFQVFSDISNTLVRESMLREELPSASVVPLQAITTKANKLEQASPINSGSEQDDSGLEVKTSPTQVTNKDIPASIFREYDIRGVAGETLTPETVRLIGQALGSMVFDRGEQQVIVARDGRLSSPDLIKSLKQGLLESGRDVIDIGEVPTPLLYFATHKLSSKSGIMLTGSHNPKEYNGLKMVISGHTLTGQDIQLIRQKILTNDLMRGKGNESQSKVVQDYINQIISDVALVQPLKVAVDCGNGIAGAVIPQLLQALGCDVIGLYCKVDGNFPNHHPDPSVPANLSELIELVKSEHADIGLAFDGDGDRLGVIDSEGNIIWPDRQLMLYAIDMLARNPGATVLYDVKCSRNLAKVISMSGGQAVMGKTGHSLIKAKMRETGALLAGECSGHIFFKERWFGFDDALYTAARLLEILSADTRKSADIFKALPNSIATPEINIAIKDDEKFEFIKHLKEKCDFGEANIVDIDGLRVEYADGWGLVRASNTSPNLVLRFEADDEQAIERIKATFRQQMLIVKGSLILNF